MTGGPQRTRMLALLGGITSGLLSAAVTAFLLVVNGSLVLVVLTSLATTAPSWFVRQGFLQFILFSLPLVLVVAQWMVWDAIRDLVFRDGQE